MQPDLPNSTGPTEVASAGLFGDPLPWPDRAGFWWCRHHWGMELVESYGHGDTEETESAWAIKSHNGGCDESATDFLPRDLAIDGDPPAFVWLSERAPFDSPNAGTQRPGTPDGPLATEPRKPGSLE